MSAIRTFNVAVEMKLTQLHDCGTIRASSLQEASALTLRLASVWQNGSPLDGLPRQPPAPARNSSSTAAPSDWTRDRLRGRGQERAGCGKHCTHTNYRAYLDRTYRDLFYQNINADSHRDMKNLKGAFINGVMGTNGARELSLCLELSDGGLARGTLRSIELTGSDAPLLLSLEAQRRLGLVLDLNREIAHGQALDRDLRLVVYNGLFGLRLLSGAFAGHSVEEITSPSNDNDENNLDKISDADYNMDDSDIANYSTEDQSPSYVATDALKSHAMGKTQATAFRSELGNIKNHDKLLWNQMCKQPTRKRVCLPRGCRTFLMDIFAGCAALTSLAQYSFGLPVSDPVDINYGNHYDLTVKANRDQLERTIEHDDHYLISLAPVCSPWSPWQRVNEAKGIEQAEMIMEERRRWLPVIQWIRKVARQRLAKGRQILIENFWGSAIWETSEMHDLLIHNVPYDVATDEMLERMRVDLCAYGLQDFLSGDPHLKPTGLATASKSLKEAITQHGRCDGSHRNEPLEGSDRCRQAQQWTPHFCYEIISCTLGDLEETTVRQAFPADFVAESGLEMAGPEDTFDEIYGPADHASPVPPPPDPQREALEQETAIPQLDVEESEALRERRRQWRILPMATRVAIRRLHNMTGHASPAAMPRLLRTAGGDPEIIRKLKLFSCPTCTAKATPTSAPATRLPGDYRFNSEISVDAFEIKDSEGNRFTILSIVDQGTLFHVGALVGEGGGQPASRLCADVLERQWISWAGPPKTAILDHGPHNRGCFSQMLAHHGCQVRFIGVESPHQLGRGERQGGILKSIMEHIIEDRQVVGRRAVETTLHESTFVKNNRVHHGGFSPAQWVLGRLLVEVDSILGEDTSDQLGIHQEVLDGESAFSQQMQIRAAAKQAYSYLDSSQRVRAAMLRKSTPMRGPVVAGDLVCFWKKGRGKGRGRWYGPARVLGQSGRATLRVVHGGIPLTVSSESLRHATGGEVLAKRELELRPSRKRRREAQTPTKKTRWSTPSRTTSSASLRLRNVGGKYLSLTFMMYLSFPQTLYLRLLLLHHRHLCTMLRMRENRRQQPLMAGHLQLWTM